MAIHHVGPYEIIVAHEEAILQRRANLFISVHKDGEVMAFDKFDMGRFSARTLRRRFPFLTSHPPRAFKDVVADATVWPKPGERTYHKNRRWGVSMESGRVTVWKRCSARKIEP